MFQIQVNYREKVCQFYINEILTDYSKLIESIVTNINSLFGCVFQVQYLNDEDSWITLGENREDVRDMFTVCLGVHESLKTQSSNMLK